MLGRGEGTVRRNVSDWEQLADLTMRLDELRSQLDAAEDGNKIAMIYALEEAIAELETDGFAEMSRRTVSTCAAAPAAHT